MDTCNRVKNRTNHFDFRRFSGGITVISFADRVVDVCLAACVSLKLDGQCDRMRLAGRNVTQFHREHLVGKTPITVQNTIHIDVILEYRRYHRGIQRVFQHDVFPRCITVVAYNDRKCGGFICIFRAFTDIHHRLIYILGNIEAGGVSRVLRFFLRYGYAVVCCCTATVIASHVHAVLQLRTGCCVKHLYIKGNRHTFTSGEIANQHGKCVATQFVQCDFVIDIHITDQLNTCWQGVVRRDVFPRRSRFIAIFDRDLVGECIAYFRFADVCRLGYNRVGFALVDFYTRIRKRRGVLAVMHHRRIDDKRALHTLVYGHIKGVHHLRIRRDCVRRKRQRA